MSFITVIKKIGEKVISIVEWPIKHSVLLFDMLKDFEEDEPKVKTAIVGLVQQFEALGPDVVQALAEKGLDIPEDLKAIADVKSLFAYFTGTFLPTIEDAYADFKKDSGADASATTGAVAASSGPQPGPGAHTVVPA